MTEDGVTVSGHGAENASEVCAVRYSPVGDEVIPSNAKNVSLARHVSLPSKESRFWHREGLLPGRQDTCCVDPQLHSKTHALLTPDSV